MGSESDVLIAEVVHDCLPLTPEQRCAKAEAEIVAILTQYHVGFSYQATYQDGRLLHGTVLVVPKVEPVEPKE